MKVKTLLKVLVNTEYNLLAESGWLREEGFIGDKYRGESNYEDWKVIKVETIKDNDILFITISE